MRSTGRTMSGIRRAMVLSFRDPTLGEDIAQEAFYRTLRRWPKVSKLDHPEAWTMVVALNCGRDVARRRWSVRERNYVQCARAALGWPD